MSLHETRSVESTYLRLAVERLARPYLEGRAVAYIGDGELEEISSGLIEAAKMMTILHASDGLTGADNDKLVHQRVMLPSLPYPNGYFEAILAFGVLEGREGPEATIREIRRVLGGGGPLVLCTPDKQAYANKRNLRDPEHRRTLYEPELRELLDAHFENVRLYRAGAVAGGLVYGRGNVETSLAVDAVDARAGDHLLAICGPVAEIENPILVLGQDGLVFEELSEARRETDLLKAEIRQMQQTEVQSFQAGAGTRLSVQSRARRTLGRKPDTQDREQLTQDREQLTQDQKRRATGALATDTEIEDVAHAGPLPAA